MTPMIARYGPYILANCILIGKRVLTVSDEEHIPAIYDKGYKDTIKFRNELRSYQIPTHWLHDKEVTPTQMADAFYASDGEYADVMGIEDRKQFARRLGKYLDAHRSTEYAVEFKCIKDRLLQNRRTRKSKERRRSRKVEGPEHEQNNTKEASSAEGSRCHKVHPIAAMGMSVYTNDRKMCNEVIAEEFRKHGIDLKHHSPETLANLMDIEMGYFDKIDKRYRKMVANRIGIYLSLVKDVNFAYLWRRKREKIKRNRRRQEQCGCTSRGTDFSKEVTPLIQDQRMAEYVENTLEPLDHLSDVDWEDLISSVDLDMDLLDDVLTHYSAQQEDYAEDTSLPSTSYDEP